MKNRITYAIPLYKRAYKSFLKNEIVQAHNIKDKATRENIITGLKAILREAKDGRMFFYDPIDGLHFIEYQGMDTIYHCGYDFVLPPNLRKDKYIMLVMDAQNCTIGTLEGTRLTTVWSEDSNVPGKHGKGGQSKARFQRAREEALKLWHKKIAAKLAEVVKEARK